MELNDSAVVHYLLQHPDFFTRNACAVEQMHIPHPVKGSVSLVEWQLARQRNQISRLEEEIALLMAQADSNQILFKRLLQLQTELTASSNIQDMIVRLNHWAHSFGLTGFDIRLFSDCWKMEKREDVTHLAMLRDAFEPLKIKRLGHERHYLGHLNNAELSLLLPAGSQTGSVALSLLGDNADLGIIIFSSQDKQHYQPGMGTTLLDYLTGLLPGLITRWIEPV